MTDPALTTEPVDRGVSWWRKILGVLWSPRIRPIWILALTGWLLFGGFRAGLLIASRSSLRNASFSDILQCFTRGFRFDSVPIGYALIPLVLALTLAGSETFSRRYFRRSVVWYSSLILTLTLFVEVVGAAFFLHFGARMNWNTIDYLGHFRELAGYIWKSYPVIPIAMLIIAFWIGEVFLLEKVLLKGGRVFGSRTGRIVVMLIMLALCILGARGGVDRIPIRGGSAYFSENNVLNQLTMNNFYVVSRDTILHIEDTEKESHLYPVLDPQRVEEVVSRLYYQEADHSSGSSKNPLWRRTITERPRRDYNVVVIVMEGMSGTPVGALGNWPSHTKEFDLLCEQGLFFDRMYGVGPRTSRGMVGVLCGYPDLLGQSIIKRDRSQGAFLTLPQIFRERNYETLFIYGGDSEFDNMKGFLTRGGVEEVIDQPYMEKQWKKEHGDQTLRGNWGMPDEVILDLADQQFRKMGDKPFFSVILTVSNHEPFDIPLDHGNLLPHDTQEHKYLNGYRYSSWALADFFEKAGKSDYFTNTIFVLVADHCRDLNRKNLIDVPGYRVPCLFYAPGIIEPKRVSTVASQTDIAPTLLAMLGGEYEQGFMGRNLLDVEEGDGFAFLHENDRMAFVRENYAVIMPPRNPASLYQTNKVFLHPLEKSQAGPDLLESLQEQMISCYQMARRLYRDRCYRSPNEIAADPVWPLAAE